jgi:hypothetical protein
MRPVPVRWRDEGISPRGAHGFLDSPPFGLNHPIAPACRDRRSRIAGAGFDPRSLGAARGHDYKGACQQRSCPPAGLDSPQVAISRLLQWLKGKTAYQLLGEFPHRRKTFWERHLGARGYFCCSAGNVADEVIAEYIATQSHDQEEDFKVDS